MALATPVLFIIEEAAIPRCMGKENDIAIAPFLGLSDDIAKFAVRISSQIVNRFRGDASQANKNMRIRDIDLA